MIRVLAIAFALFCSAPLAEGNLVDLTRHLLADLGWNAEVTVQATLSHQLLVDLPSPVIFAGDGVEAMLLTPVHTASSNQSDTTLPEYFRNPRRVGVNRSALLEESFFVEIDGIRYRARTEELAKRTEGVGWRGKIGDSPFTSTITTRNDLTRGSLWVRDGVLHGRYELLSRGGETFIAEPDPEVGVNLGNDVAHPPRLETMRGPRVDSSASRRRPVARRTDPCRGITPEHHQIDLMYLYDSYTIKHSFGGEEETQLFARFVADAINSALRDSRIKAWVNLVYAGRVDFGAAEDEQISIQTAFQLIRSHPEAVRLRNEYGADVIGFLSGGVTGAGLAAPDFTSVARGTHVAWPYLEYAIHEFGHNLGMHHNPNSASPPNPPPQWSFAKGHHVSAVFRTAVAYPHPCEVVCPVIPIFSNPEILVDGHPAGLANERDNARMGNIAAPIVAGYFETLKEPCAKE